MMPPEVVRTTSELSGGQEVVGPLLDVPDSNVEPWGDDSALVESSSQVDNDFARSVIIHNLELPDVAVLHHDGEEPDDDLGAGPEEDLSLSSLLCIVHAPEGVSQ